MVDDILFVLLFEVIIKIVEIGKDMISENLRIIKIMDKENFVVISFYGCYIFMNFFMYIIYNSKFEKIIVV